MGAKASNYFRRFLPLLFWAISTNTHCAGLPAGKVVWWGRDNFWRNIYSSHTNGVIENDDEILSNVISVTANVWQGLLLTSDGMVVGVGHNSFGGNNVPAGFRNVVSFAAEGSSYWAINRDGAVAKWGSDRNDANSVAGLSNIVSITWVDWGYFALRNDGTVLGFRLDNGGHVPGYVLIDPTTGLPTAEGPQFRPVKVRGQVLSNIVAVASIGITPVVLKKDGTVYGLSPGRTDAFPNVRHPLENSCDWICRMVIRKTRDGLRPFPLPGGEDKGEGERSTNIHRQAARSRVRKGLCRRPWWGASLRRDNGVILFAFTEQEILAKR